MERWKIFWSIIAWLAVLWLIAGSVLSAALSPDTAEQINENCRFLRSQPMSSTDCQTVTRFDVIIDGLRFFGLSGLCVLLPALYMRNLNIEKRRHQEILAALRYTPDNMQEQLDAARALILTRQYPQARALLETLDHPRAAEWLAKIETAGSGEPHFIEHRGASRHTNAR